MIIIKHDINIMLTIHTISGLACGPPAPGQRASEPASVSDLRHTTLYYTILCYATLSYTMMWLVCYNILYYIITSHTILYYHNVLSSTKRCYNIKHGGRGRV